MANAPKVLKEPLSFHSAPIWKTQHPDHFEGGIPPLFVVQCRPEGPAAGAKRPHAAEGHEGERSETIVPEATD